MTQPKIEGVGHGVPRMLYASDGSNWYAILVDSDGHVKVDIVSALLPTDAATETTLALIKGYVDTLETLLAGGLPAALDTFALKVKEQSPLTGFATSANQATMITALQLIDDFALGTNKIFGYYDRYLEEIKNLSATAGTNILLGTVVPAGEVWVANSLVGVNFNTNPTAIRLGIYDGATYYTLFEKLAPGSNARVSLNVPMYLKAGDYLFAYFSGCTLNDDIYLDANGYKMKIA